MARCNHSHSDRLARRYRGSRSTPRPARRLFGLGLLVVCLAGSGSGVAIARVGVDADAPAAGINAFALDLYQQLADSPGNICFSPFSLSSALAMTYAGARGETEAQMARVLHFGDNGESFHEAYGDLSRSMRAAGDLAEGPRLVVANALWAQEDFSFLDWYFELVTSRYDAALRNVDFTGDPAGARRTINDWVARQTAGKILDLLGPGSVGPLTRLILTNAVYFRGAWVLPFAEKSPAAPFLLAGGERVEVPMMHQTGRLSYFEGQDPEGADFQVLELPYRETRLAMLIVLPSRGRPLDDFAAGVTPERLGEWIEGLEPLRVSVFLPRFALRAALDLAGTLGAMGMPDAFHQQTANFSGMTGSPDLFISSVLHKAFLEVTEQGTEAAAASAVVMALKSSGQDPRARKPVFRADHPFLFLIRDRETGVVLFLGRLVDPRG
ncbi:MAG: serpin family protein [Candidatus Eisenbacteria sp.]|nr:serpin family protein [Candidatus Eisenbacteria bacterium]